MNWLDLRAFVFQPCFLDLPFSNDSRDQLFGSDPHGLSKVRHLQFADGANLRFLVNFDFVRVDLLAAEVAVAGKFLVHLIDDLEDRQVIVDGNFTWHAEARSALGHRQCEDIGDDLGGGFIWDGFQGAAALIRPGLLLEEVGGVDQRGGWYGFWIEWFQCALPVPFFGNLVKLF